MVERSMRKQNWFWIGHDVIKNYGRKMGANGIAVYNCLCMCASKDQICFPSQDTMKNWTGIDLRTIRAAIKNLEVLGLLIKQKQGKNTVYMLTDPNPSQDKNVPLIVQKCTLDTVQKCPTNYNHITKTNNNIYIEPSALPTPSLLTLFYKKYEEKHGLTYPNKNYAKHGALLKKPNDSVGGEIIERAIGFYYERWKNHNFEQFIYKLPEILPKCADRPAVKVDEFAAYRSGGKTGA